MRILLISPNKQELTMRVYPLGMAMVHAALAKGGHDALAIDTMGLSGSPDSIRTIMDDFKPDMIGVSVRNIDDQNMGDPSFLLDESKAVMEEIRDSTDKRIVLGGPGYSMFPGACLDYLGADYGIQGEGEISLRVLLEGGGPPGLYIRGSGLAKERDYIKDLNQIPLPGPKTIYPPLTPDEDFWAPIQTRRGCPMKCIYCSTPIIEGCSHRRRDIRSVIQWLRAWVDAGFRRFFFVDNTFNLPPFYAKKLCRAIIEAELEIQWRCIIYPILFDADLAHLMAQAGCVDLSLGCESGDNQALHSMNKLFLAKDVRETSDILGHAGIRRIGFLMLGCPGETRESVMRSLEFIDSLNLDSVKITKGIRIYPHTRLWEIAVEKGLISPEEDLLYPRFYMEEGLGDWIEETIDIFARKRPNWIL
jgi:radical SAM superfamily enzyme YgiQ (UPF0313 family)